jgi:malonyl CoA-acyl carrier protein transacylase
MIECTPVCVCEMPGGWIWLGVLLVSGGVALVVSIRREQTRQDTVEAFFMAFTHDLKTTLASLQLQAESLVEDRFQWVVPLVPLLGHPARFERDRLGLPDVLKPASRQLLRIEVLHVRKAAARCAHVTPAVEPPAGAVGASLGVLTALTLAAVTVVPELLKTQFNIAVLINGTLITVTVAIAVAMQDLLRRQT